MHGRTGRPRVSDRDVLASIAFVLSTGIGGTKLPMELGCGSGWTFHLQTRQAHGDNLCWDAKVDLPHRVECCVV